MSTVRVRYIGDQPGPSSRVKSFIEKVAKEQFMDVGISIDYDSCISSNIQDALDTSLHLIKSDPRWMQFEALVLDILWVPGNLVGLEVIYDGLCKGLKSVSGAEDYCPWKHVYVSSICAEDDRREWLLREAQKRGIGSKCIFISAPKDDPNTKLATKIIRDYLDDAKTGSTWSQAQ